MRAPREIYKSVPNSSLSPGHFKCQSVSGRKAVGGFFARKTRLAAAFGDLLAITVHFHDVRDSFPSVLFSLVLFLEYGKMRRARVARYQRPLEYANSKSNYYSPIRTYLNEHVWVSPVSPGDANRFAPSRFCAENRLSLSRVKFLRLGLPPSPFPSHS